MTIVGQAEVLILPEFGRFERDLRLGVARSGNLAVGEVDKAAAKMAGVAGKASTATAAAGKKALGEVEAVAVRSSTGIGRAFESLRAGGARQLNRLADQGAQHLGKLGFVGVEAAELIKGGMAGAATAGVLAFAALAAGGIAEFTKLTGEVRKFQRVSGAGAEEASKLVAAARRLGVPVEALARGFVFLSRNVELGTVDFKALGVEIVRAGDGTVDTLETFLNLADAVQALGPGAAASTLAVQALGRGGAALLPILLKGREGLSELFAEAERRNQVFNDDDLQKGKDFSVAVSSLKEAFSGFSVELGQKVIPFVTDFVTVLTGAFDLINLGINLLGGAVAAFEDLGPAFQAALIPLKLMVNPIGLIGDAMGHSAGKAKELEEAVEASTEAIESLASIGLATIDATLARRNAESSFAGAVRESKKAQQELAELQAGPSKDALEKIASAHKGAERAARSLADAHENEADALDDLVRAQRRLNDLQRSEADRTARAVERASLTRERAARSLTEAQESLVEAEEDLARIRAGTDEETLRKIADAEQRLADARNAAVEAARSLTESQNVLAKAQRDFDEAAASGDVHAQARAFARLQAAQQQRADAQAEIDKADAERAKAEADVLDARRVDPDAEREAQQAVTDATLSIRDARLSLRDATDGVTEAERAQREGSAELIAAREQVTNLAERHAEAQQSVIDQQDALAEARGAEREALLEAIPTTEALADAQQRVADTGLAAEGAAISLAKALTDEKFAGVQISAETRFKSIAGFLGNIASTIDGPLRQAVDDYINDFMPGMAAATQQVTDDMKAAFSQKVKDEHDETISLGDIVESFKEVWRKGIIPGIPGFAAGGSIAAGQLSIVGERGPEFFVPNTSGAILNQAQAQVAFARGMGGLNDDQTLLLLRQILAAIGAVQQPLVGQLTLATDAAGAGRTMHSALSAAKDAAWMGGAR